MGASSHTPSELGASAAAAALTHIGSLSHEDLPTSAIVVALPNVLDPVRLIGSEDKHTTLLFFGEAAALGDEAKANVLATVSQVAAMTSPFSSGIRSVERLGEETPPALVAHLNGHTLENIRRIMMVNPMFSMYLANAQQYPTYMPHVTFSYPDFAEEAKLRALASSLHRVRYDRLAVWWGAEQYEFALRYEGDDEGADGAWSEELMENYLAHYGRKGMKWGRKIFSGGGATGKAPAGLPRDASDDFAKAVAAKSKPASSLSNAEMRQLIERVELERRYNTTVAPPKVQTRRAATGKFVKKLLLEVGREEVTRVTKGSAKVGTKMLLEGSKMTGKDFAKSVAKTAYSGGKKK